MPLARAWPAAWSTSSRPRFRRTPRTRCVRGRTPEPEQGSLTDIAERVGAAIGTDATGGANLVQASLRAVAEAVDRDLLDRIRAQLPSDLQRLLQTEHEGDTSAVHTGA
jgi:hypothetical protein